MAGIGDIYRSNRSSIPYTIQFLARDLTALNSDVIAIWKRTDNINTITSSEPDLFLHTTILAGEKLGYWEKTTKLPPVDYSKATFKQADIDYLADDVEEERNAKRWHTWRINEEWVNIKKNLYKDDNFYPGEVYPPLAVNYFIQHNKWPSEEYIESLKPGVDY